MCLAMYTCTPRCASERKVENRVDRYDLEPSSRLPENRSRLCTLLCGDVCRAFPWRARERHVNRILARTDARSADSVIHLFGRDIRDQLAGLTGDAREERAIREYMRSLKRAGNFLYVGSAVVFKAEIETPHFHLMYGTRDNKGVAVFKEVEEKLFGETRDVRADAKALLRSAWTGMESMFAPGDMHKSTAMEERRARYLATAKARVQQGLERNDVVDYDKVWRIALSDPLVWESDFKSWIAEWRAVGYGIAR